MSGPSALLQQPFAAPPRCEVPLPAEAIKLGWDLKKWNDFIHKTVTNLQHLEYLSGKMFFPMTSADADKIKAQMHDINVEMENHFVESGLSHTLSNMVLGICLLYPGLKVYLTPQQAMMMVATGTHNDIAKL